MPGGGTAGAAGGGAAGGAGGVGVHRISHAQLLATLLTSWLALLSSRLALLTSWLALLVPLEMWLEDSARL